MTDRQFAPTRRLDIKVRTKYLGSSSLQQLQSSFVQNKTSAAVLALGAEQDCLDLHIAVDHLLEKEAAIQAAKPRRGGATVFSFLYQIGDRMCRQ